MQVFKETISSVEDADRLMIVLVASYCDARGETVKEGTPELFAQYLYEQVLKGLTLNALRPTQGAAEPVIN
jgi:hypothetical protein